MIGSVGSPLLEEGGGGFRPLVPLNAVLFIVMIPFCIITNK